MQQLVTFEDNKILVRYDAAWFQEDIKKLADALLSRLEQYKIKEKFIGADRESIRFCWQEHFNFMLHYDYYSQSCWLEASDDISKDKVIHLFKNLQDC